MARQQYWVYVNSSLRKSQVHKSNCGSCKFGLQLRSNRTSGEDWWGGPFDSRDEALSYARSESATIGADASLCPLCRP